MKRHIPYFSFYPSDFMNGVRGLTAQEVGVYTMLLCRIYEENGPVEYSILKLSTYCGMREATFQKVIEKLIDLGKLTVTDGLVSNSRAEAEISKRANDLKINSKAGKASAEKRKEKQGNESTDVQRPFNHTDTDTDTKKDIALSRAKVTPERFDEFWDAYPHRGGVRRGRKPSLARYERIVRAGTPEQALIDAARRYGGDRRVVDGFAKDPATWLNQSGWEDGVEALARASPANDDKSAKLAQFSRIAGAK